MEPLDPSDPPGGIEYLWDIFMGGILGEAGENRKIFWGKSSKGAASGAAPKEQP